MADQMTRVDDLDGTPGAERIHLGWGDKLYELDLCHDNLVELEDLLARYLEVAPMGRPRQDIIDQFLAARQAEHS